MYDNQNHPLSWAVLQKITQGQQNKGQRVITSGISNLSFGTLNKTGLYKETLYVYKWY